MIRVYSNGIATFESSVDFIKIKYDISGVNNDTIAIGRISQNPIFVDYAEKDFHELISHYMGEKIESDMLEHNINRIDEAIDCESKTFNFRGTKITISVNLLMKMEYFKSMMSGRFTINDNPFIDKNPLYFMEIIDILRKYPYLSEIPLYILEELKFYQFSVNLNELVYRTKREIKFDNYITRQCMGAHILDDMDKINGITFIPGEIIKFDIPESNSRCCLKIIIDFHKNFYKDLILGEDIISCIKCGGQNIYTNDIKKLFKITKHNSQITFDIPISINVDTIDILTIPIKNIDLCYITIMAPKISNTAVLNKIPAIYFTKSYCHNNHNTNTFEINDTVDMKNPYIALIIHKIFKYGRDSIQLSLKSVILNGFNILDIGVNYKRIQSQYIPSCEFDENLCIINTSKCEIKHFILIYERDVLDDNHTSPLYIPYILVYEQPQN